jgi:hypothetical protein
MFMDGHRPRGQAIFIHFYFLSALFFFTFDFSLVIRWF